MTKEYILRSEFQSLVIETISFHNVSNRITIVSPMFLVREQNQFAKTSTFEKPQNSGYSPKLTQL
jgi:hypothetical protein